MSGVRKLFSGFVRNSAVPGVAVAVAATALSLQAHAAVDEILVTAQRREESLQEVPISVVAFSPEALDNSGVNSTAGLTQLVPSVQLVRTGPSSVFFMRGVGNSSAGTGEEGANSFYVDGVYLPDLKQTVMKFNNIERVEVLKGPQGTLFGRNSSGGLVNVITHEPGDSFEAKVNAGFANYETYSSQAYLAGPLTDTLSADIALTATDQNDGWGHNEITAEDIQEGWDWGVRSKWVWRPSDVTKITLVGEYSHSADNFAMSRRILPGTLGLSGNAPPADWHNTNTPDQQETRMELYGLNLTAEFDLDWATLTSITATRDNKNHSTFDLDAGPLPQGHLVVHDRSHSFQEELRLASNSEGPLNWQTGLFLMRTEVNLYPLTQTGTIFGANQNVVYSSLDTTSWAGFGEVGYTLDTGTTLTAGLRYTHDNLDFEGEQRRISDNARLVLKEDTLNTGETTYRLAIRQDLTDTLNVYASYNRGFKSGTYPMTNPAQPPVDTQTIDAYEVGLKSMLFEDRLRLNLSAFHYDIDDYQVRSSLTVPPAPPQTLLLNAAKVTVDGFELEFEAVPTDNLRLFGAASWLNSEFDDFPQAPFGTPRTGAPWGTTTSVASAAGYSTPMSPNFAGNIGVTYTLPAGQTGDVDLSVLYSYNEGYYFEPDNRVKQPSFNTVNASIAYNPTPNWAVELWGRNLTDETYYIQQASASLGDIGVVAAPRTYGVTFKYNY